MTTEELVKVLLDRMVEKKLEFSHMKREVSTSQFLEQFCTARLSLGRRSGYTETIASLFSPETDHVVFYNQQQMSLTQPRLNLDKNRGHVMKLNPHARSVTDDTIIWVDNASLFGPSQMLEMNLSISARARGYPTIMALG